MQADEKLMVVEMTKIGAGHPSVCRCFHATPSNVAAWPQSCFRRSSVRFDRGAWMLHICPTLCSTCEEPTLARPNPAPVSDTCEDQHVHFFTKQLTGNCVVDLAGHCGYQPIHTDTPGVPPAFSLSGRSPETPAVRQIFSSLFSGACTSQ